MVRVAIIGGGYAGLMAARTLANRGYGDKVVVIDRRFRAGFPPASTSGVALYWLKQYGLLPDQASVSGVINSIRFITPVGKKEHVFGISGGLGTLLNSAAVVLDEPDFCGRIEKDAVAKGVEFRHGHSFQDVETLHPIFNRNGDVKYDLSIYDRSKQVYHEVVDYVIACDGYDSRFGRRMGLTTQLPPESFHKGYEITVPPPEGSDPTQIIMWFGKGNGTDGIAPGGYIWNFPSKEDGVPMRRVGIGIPRSVPVAPIVYFNRFLSSHPEYDTAKTHHRVGGVIPTYHPPRKVSCERALITGDALRACIPTTGGGIAPAIITGFEAGRAVAGDIDGSDMVNVHTYPRQIRFLLKEVRTHYILKQALFTLSDEEIEKFAQTMASYPVPKVEDIDPFAERRRVTKYFLRHLPGLALRIPFRGRNWEMLKTMAGF